MVKIVLTGGPCSGKTTVLEALRGEFKDDVVLVPEVATILLEGGFPIPGKHLEWTPEWQECFQTAILPLQRSLEDTYSLANPTGKILVCDRGVLDGAAYTPGGTHAFCQKYGVDLTKATLRYGAVLHLESLALADPEKYGTAGNSSRFESLDEARRLDQSHWDSWSSHPNHIQIRAHQGVEGKIAEVIGIIRTFLAPSTPA